jgi:hypothetical protein
VPIAREYSVQKVDHMVGFDYEPETDAEIAGAEHGVFRPTAEAGCPLDVGC